MPSFFNLTGCLTIDTLILQINPMPKKIILLLSLTLLLSVAAFVLWRINHISAPVVTRSGIVEDVKNGYFLPHTETLPTFEDIVAPDEINRIKLPSGELYTSEKNKFSVLLPPGTKVEERDEKGNYTITYFKLKDSVHVIEIRTYNENVYEGNLKSIIDAGEKEKYFLTGEFDQKHQVYCGDVSSLCFLSRAYSQPNSVNPGPNLMRLVQYVISRTDFSKFYNISMGAYHPELSYYDLAIFNMIHSSFRILR